jgi:phospholipase C
MFRHTFLAFVLLMATSTGRALGQSSDAAVSADTAASGQASPIRHVVIVVMENHSFDSLFGTFPGANGATTGKIGANTISLNHLTDQPPSDFNHTRDGSRADVDGGLMDAFNRDNCSSPPYWCYGQYWESDIPNLWAYASTFALVDNAFSSVVAPSYANHQYLIAAQSGGVVSNPNNGGGAWGCDSNAVARVSLLPPPPAKSGYAVFPCFDYPVLPDLLDPAGITWKFYGPTPATAGFIFVSLDAIKHIRYGADWTKVVDWHTFKSDALSGNLPAVSWLQPDSNDSQHPTSSMRVGENWIVNNLNALMEGPDWASTVVFITWDDWGGFYDHVPPPMLDYLGANMRVPIVVLSPYAKPGYITSHNAAIHYYTFESMLAYVEHNFGLGSLTTRDAQAADLSDTLNYSQTPLPPLILKPRPEPALTRPILLHGQIIDPETNQVIGHAEESTTD